MTSARRRAAVACSTLCIALSSVSLVALISPLAVVDECHALLLPAATTAPPGSCGRGRSSECVAPSHHRRGRRRGRALAMAATSGGGEEERGGGGDDDDDDEALLESVEPDTLRNLCEQYSLPSSGTKIEMLARLRGYAAEQAELDRERRRGRSGRVEASLDGTTKARHTIVEGDAFESDDYDEADDDEGGYFYYEAPVSPEEKKRMEEEERRRRKSAIEAARKKMSSHITSPPPPEDVKPNEKGERVVTLYSTTDKNDLTDVTSMSPTSEMSLENARYQAKPLISSSNPEESLAGGPFGDTSGSRRRKASAEQSEEAKEGIREVVRNLLATTGAPAFRDDYDDDDASLAGDNEFYGGFTGFDPSRIPPELLSSSSRALRVDSGRPLREVLSEYELQAIGHDGLAADDASKGGGHYREVTKVGAFLEGYRKAEERRVSRETSAMLLDRLVKEGVKGLDALLAGMVREGDELSVSGSADGEGAGELNSALVRYLEEAIREQEVRVKNAVPKRVDNAADNPEDELDLMWNVTRGDDGTIIETIDPNAPEVRKLLRDELEKTRDGAGIDPASLSSMTVQEKMLLLLRMLRDRVKVEAVVGNDEHARNLRVLAYCLKAANDEERQSLIVNELGNSLDALDIFSDLVTASIDYAEARSNDDFAPGGGGGDRGQKNLSPVLNVAKLQKIKVIVERVKGNQTWKASGVSPQ